MKLNEKDARNIVAIVLGAFFITCAIALEVHIVLNVAAELDISMVELIFHRSGDLVTYGLFHGHTTDCITSFIAAILGLGALACARFD